MYSLINKCGNGAIYITQYQLNGLAVVKLSRENS